MHAPQSQKFWDSLLGPFERKFIHWAIPKIPSWIHSYHLTNLSLIWWIGILLLSWIAREQWQIFWLHGVSFMLLLHWLTDSLDGSLGRHRKEGLIQWWFYMDHLYDFFLLWCLLLGYNYLIPDLVYHIGSSDLQLFLFSWEIQYSSLLFFIYILLSCFMVHSFLYFWATQKFKIAYCGIGPTEVRLIFIIINTFIVVFWKTYLAWSLPYVVGVLVIWIVLMIYRTQKELVLSDRNKL